MEYIVSMNRKILNDICSMNVEFANVFFNDNTIKYEDTLIYLDDFQLIKLFDEYGRFKLDLPYMEIVDIIKIIKVNVLAWNTLNNKNDLRESFVDFMNGEHENSIDEYNSLISEMISIEDYLISEVNELVIEYQSYMLHFKGSDDNLIKEQISIYEELLSKANNNKINFMNIIIKKRNQLLNPESGGYINSFFLAFVTCILGFSLALVILFYN